MLSSPSLGWLAGWLPAWLAGWLAGWLAAWLAGWLPGCLAGWMAGWLAAGHSPKVFGFPNFSENGENHLCVFVDIFGELMGPTMCICIHVHHNLEPTKP